MSMTVLREQHSYMNNSMHRRGGEQSSTVASTNTAGHHFQTLGSHGVVSTGAAASTVGSTTTTGRGRRSHRPRGCRGGRKNRKNLLAKAAALLPKEILDSPAPLSPQKQVAATGGNSNNNHRETKTTTTNQNHHHHHVGGDHGARGRSVGENHNRAYAPFLANRGKVSAFEPTTHFTATTPTPFLQPFQQLYNSDNRPSTKNNNNDGALGNNNNSSIVVGSGGHHHHQQQRGFRPLRENIGSLGSVATRRFEKQMSLPEQGDRSAMNLYHNSTTSHRDILPPLPAAAQRSGTSPIELHSGPNPYALTSLQTSYTDSSNDSLGDELDAMNNPPGPPRPSSQASSTSSSNNTTGTTTATGGGETTTNADYRHHRIQKQRQMLANGGSLFVTSPRSFLLGRTKSATTVW